MKKSAVDIKIHKCCVSQREHSSLSVPLDRSGELCIVRDGPVVSHELCLEGLGLIPNFRSVDVKRRLVIRFYEHSFGEWLESRVLRGSEHTTQQ